jgi:hypothetical protein
MNTEKTRTWFSNRQFIAMVQSALDDAGQTETAINRQWLDEDTEGYPLIVHVPVGPALAIPLLPLSSFFTVKSVEELKWHTDEFALALVNLKRAEKSLRKYVRDVRTAAEAEIVAARADGLDILLQDVGLKPTYAHHLTSKNWKDAASRVLASVSIRQMSFFLQPEVREISIEESASISDEIATIRVEQRKRQVRLAELDALGADLIVDTLTLDLLEAHGLDADKVLSKVWKTQCVNLTVQHLERDTPLSLISSNGKVSASLILDEAIWNGEHLWLRDGNLANGNEGLVGGTLGELVPHPVFASRTVVEVLNRDIDHFSFDLSEKALFDANTGRIWREERLAE